MKALRVSAPERCPVSPLFERARRHRSARSSCDDLPGALDRAVVANVATMVSAAMRGERPVVPTDRRQARRALRNLRHSVCRELERPASRYSGREVAMIWRAFDRAERALQESRSRGTSPRNDEAVRGISEVLHDLRSPLTSILCLSDLLYEQQQRAGDAAAQRQVALIHSAALGMHEMVCDFRDLALRLDALLEPRAIPFALSDVVDTVVALLRPTAEEKGLELRVSVGDGITHVGHPAATKRVLLNLATNALRFTDRGHVGIHIQRLGGKLVMTVADTGSGLPADVERVLTDEGSWTLRKTGEQGLGVGLSICKQLVQRLGGSITVDTVRGAGTTVRVELPNALDSHPGEVRPEATPA